MAIELPKISQPGSKALMGYSRLDKVPRTSAPESLCYCCTFTCLTLPLFPDTRHGVKDVEGCPLPLMQCDCLMDISISLDIFACGLL